MVSHRFIYLLAIFLACFSGLLTMPASAAPTDISDVPLFIGGNGTPLTLLVMGRDHKLYYEAYNDASDLNGDGVTDVGYKPDLKEWNSAAGTCKQDADGNCIALDYYGYFDSHKCYTYTNGRFEPLSATINKKCSGAWSGDFLNYLTTSRMDALRRVLYGGYRSTDDSTMTVLERSYIPQDAHSWGKEYESEARDGYLISDYTPLSQPSTDKRHLFANTTLLCPTGSTDPGCTTNSGLPLLRVLTNTKYRIWEWVSKEQPVAGNQCIGGNCVNTSMDSYAGNPNDHAEYEALVTLYATSAHEQGSQPVDTINGSGNPFGDDDYYLNIFKGTLQASSSLPSGNYQFAVDGDDAIELIIDGTVVAAWYDGHGACNCQTHTGSIYFTAGSTHTVEFRHQESTGADNYKLWWKVPGATDWTIVPKSTGGRGFTSLTQTVYDVKTAGGVAMTDYVVRVKACEQGASSSFTREVECQGYPNNSPTIYKPTGLLQQYGEPDRMAFGLLTGSYTNNLSGGVLRKNISSLTDEIDLTNGTLKTGTTPGIIQTIDKLKVYGFLQPYYHSSDCQVPEVNPMQQGRCRMWGNPIAEMMYEGLRYFAGKTSGTSVFTSGVSGTSTDDTKLGLPLPSWKDPYRTTTGDVGYPKCSKPFQLVISDINPSFDTDQLPGSYFLGDTNNPKDKSGNSLATPTFDLSDLNVADRADTIWNGEKANEGTNVFIGQSQSTYDGAPTAKTIDNFKNIRGLTPEEPSRQGGYYAASVAFYGHTKNNGFGPGKQKVDTFSVALASPLPQIEIPIDVDGATKKITLVPFGKSVSWNSINPDPTKFQPTNTIVDFYVETIKNTGAANLDSAVNAGRPYGKFRINFEDSEYGSDHDMDAIVTYEFIVNADKTLTINLSSNYAAGSIVQHMGYIISGSNHDGVYLEVLDTDTPNWTNTYGDNTDVDYFLDTPPGCYAYVPGSSNSQTNLACRKDGIKLPLTASRTFSAGNSSAVFIKHDPLWYAAKWGGFIEDKVTANDLPTNAAGNNKEWDSDNNSVPDNYFLVTNASRLKDQLTQAFERIITKSSSSAAVAVNTGTFNLGQSRIYQVKFHSSDWSGHLVAYSLNPDGSPKQAEWDGGTELLGQDFNTGRKILTYRKATGATGDTVDRGIRFRWPSNLASLGTTDLSLAQVNALKGSDAASVGEARLEFLRGSSANEGEKGLKLFRLRMETDETTQTRVPFVLGDIINSNPTYIAAPQMRFDALLKGTGTTNEAAAYSDFRTAHKNRAAMVYVGSNDGMLHGFAAADGAEKIAYVPNLVFANLAKLTEPNYNAQHRFFVDGSPKIGDVYWDNAVGDSTYDREDWHTILVGSLRKGGTGLFALDITDPTNFSESNAANLVLWEFTDANLGYTFSQPSLVRLNNGKWAAVFGNGYNPANGHAILYLIDAKSGGNTSATPAGLKIVLDTNSTNVASLGTSANPNGLSTPLMIDLNSDGIADYAYAGDLFGNLWRFNLSSSDSSTWSVTRIFTATDGASPTANAQSITSKPLAVRHPNGGLVILFGTGRYLGATDTSTTAKQTFYGIWDQDPSVAPTTPLPTRAKLQQQTITTLANPINGQTFRISSATDVCWNGDTCTDSGGNTVSGQSLGWYIDLPGLSATAPAERVTSDPLLVGQNVVFTSIGPSSDPCEFGGVSWLNVIDATTGKRPSESFVDLAVDDNGNVTATPIKADITENGQTTSGAVTSLQQDVITSAPTKMDAPYAINIYTTDSEGKVRVSHLSAAGLTGRLSWRQLELEQ